ncbi:alpha/beta fold hydrolase [Tunicatimonas pelagia]|uniref:alpha/beta fold hydrolase n=1 Tax=Tunicatimonas pelagia TaxID=931531 RepID=UPI002666C4A5|nr:alpha/beta hydrolase [Tunicatimonas pelagia]WKN43970.1 alpha/beta hydrolase [Tunicatimonas pelagia]
MRNKNIQMQLAHEDRKLSINQHASKIHPDIGDVLTLSDGRKVGYLDVGDPNGAPVFYNHGAASSRIEALFFAESAANLNIRIIGVDRPGMGLSDYQEGLTFLSWASDLAEVADYLNIKRFSVAGTSGGGAYACACGAHQNLANRINAIILIAGMLPATKEEKRAQSAATKWTLKLADSVPFLCGLIMQSLKGVAKRSVQTGDFMGRKGWGSIMGYAQLSSFRNGTKGAVRDAALYAHPLGFELKEIGVPVMVFVGTEDTNVPIGIAKRVVREVKNSKLHIFDGEDHQGILGRGQEILEASIKFAKALKEN